MMGTETRRRERRKRPEKWDDDKNETLRALQESLERHQ
jgi:hypothetical protein